MNRYPKETQKQAIDGFAIALVSIVIAVLIFLGYKTITSTIRARGLWLRAEAIRHETEQRLGVEKAYFYKGVDGTFVTDFNWRMYDMPFERTWLPERDVSSQYGSLYKDPESEAAVNLYIEMIDLCATEAKSAAGYGLALIAAITFIFVWLSDTVREEGGNKSRQATREALAE